MKGTKITPPERDLLKFMSRKFTASAEDLHLRTAMPKSKITAKLRRLVSLGHVEQVPGSGSTAYYRLTTQGVDWKLTNMPVSPSQST